MDDKTSNAQDPTSTVHEDHEARHHSAAEATASSNVETRHQSKSLFRSLGVLDRLLTPAILLAMIAGVLIGVYVPGVQNTFGGSGAKFGGVSVPIAVGLIAMMYPVLTKVQYERLLPFDWPPPHLRSLDIFPVAQHTESASNNQDQYKPSKPLLKSRKLWTHILTSLLLNWVFGPLIMLALAWATLPDHKSQGYREGVILVGLGRCIAMVMIWNQLARGNGDYCAILVVLNSLLQVVLYSPYALLFINVIGSGGGARVKYGVVAISVLVYLGIPLLLGLLTRLILLLLFPPTHSSFFHNRFLPYFTPLSFLGLLYTILVIFASQGERIVRNIGEVFRVCVPMVLYFLVMWVGSVGVGWQWFGRREREACKRRSQRSSGVEQDSQVEYVVAETREDKGELVWSYEMIIVQAFTAGSNNFELAIAVAISVWGADSDQALAATVGPLVEVPVLLGLTWVALWLRGRWDLQC